ncbi:MAG: acyl-homoserine-lactone synthase, partial [Pseudomonadota bacterium]
QKSVFGDRAQQFVSRLKWNLCVTPTGLEVDEYDDSESQYLLVHRNSGHLGSCRVRPITASTMLVDHFLPLFPQAQSFLEMQRGRVFELTRFCRAPDISVGESRQMLAKLACLLDSFRDAQRLTGFVAVVFPQVCRFLDSIGVRYLVISKSQLDGREVDLICITHAKRVGAKADPAPMLDVATPRLAA